jgi:hypothetical protein
VGELGKKLLGQLVFDGLDVGGELVVDVIWVMVLFIVE